MKNIILVLLISTLLYGCTTTKRVFNPVYLLQVENVKGKNNIKTEVFDAENNSKIFVFSDSIVQITLLLDRDGFGSLSIKNLNEVSLFIDYDKSTIIQNGIRKLLNKSNSPSIPINDNIVIDLINKDTETYTFYEIIKKPKRIDFDITRKSEYLKAMNEYNSKIQYYLTEKPDDKENTRIFLVLENFDKQRFFYDITISKKGVEFEEIK